MKSSRQSQTGLFSPNSLKLKIEDSFTNRDALLLQSKEELTETKNSLEDRLQELREEEIATKDILVACNMLLEYKQIIEWCKNRNFPELVEYIQKGMSYWEEKPRMQRDLRLLASAAIDCYHPDIEMRRKYGLKFWEDQLSSSWESLLKSEQNKINLLIVLHAYKIALDGEEYAGVPHYGLQDLKAAEKLKEFAQTHKATLAKELYGPGESDEIIWMFTKHLGDLSSHANVKDNEVTLPSNPQP